MMYWGNPDATNLSNSTLVFDTSEGFQGVWHLNENGNDSALNATTNLFNGASYYIPINNRVNGAIGYARTFDGDFGYLIIPNTANGKLNFSE